MDQIPVVSERQLDGGDKLVRRLVERGFRLTGACWAKTPRYSRGYLYLVSPAVERVDPGSGYREVRAALTDLEGEWTHPLERVDPFDVMLVGPETDVGKALDWSYKHYPGPGPTFQYGWLGASIPLEETGAYIYPPELFAHPAPAGG